MLGLDKRKLVMITGGLMALASLFYILSTALPSWVTSGYVEAGLWKVCLSFGGSKSCGSIGDCGETCGKLNGARAFMILALLTSIIATIIIFMNLFQSSSNPMVAQATRFLAITALPLGIIGVALGISYYSGGDGSLGAAAILGIMALIINVAGGGIAVMIQ